MALDAGKAVTATLTGDGKTQLTLFGAFRKGASATLDGARAPVTRVPGGIRIAVDLSEEGEHTLMVR